MENDAAAIAQYSDPAYVLGWSPAMAPIILTHAVQTATPGTAATFSIVAAAVPAPTYQWQLNGVAITDGNGISGATTAALTLNAAAAKAGKYTVTVTNSAGSVTSGATNQTAN
jgi:hypothetical protein